MSYSQTHDSVPLQLYLSRAGFQRQPISVLLSLIVLGLLARAFYRWWKWHRMYKLPPTVPGLPILGNIFQVPYPSGMWLKSLAEKHGEMFSLKLGSKTWVFLNSSRVVDDLLEKRSAIYSSRARFPMAQELMSGNMRFLLMPYGDRWRGIRKIMHQVLNSRQADKFQVYQEVESRRLLHDYLHHPDKWYRSNQQFANSVILSVVFGRVSNMDDPTMAELFSSLQDFLRNIKPGANLVDMFHWLASLPTWMQWWRPKGIAHFERSKAMYFRELDFLKKRVKDGTAKPCFALDYMEAKGDIDHEQVETAFVFGTLMEAGSDTSRVSIGQGVAAAAIYGDWVKKAREELDEVCGDAERLPEFSDRDRLPYLSAVVKEILRWRPFIQSGTGRELIQDDEYEGYKFPAGTVFVWNPWAIALNPDEYEDPLTFKPERFLNDQLRSPLKGHWAFGAGRRVCVGYNVADTNVWIATSRLIYCFDFEQVPGSPIDTFHTLWEAHDKPAFPVKIKCRSQKHAQLIENMYASLSD
ncbi:related to cytochrome P450 [Fusarium oxysporum]|uniref:Related to cytochrome P450 n=1 Tax=Fusarium oxysporum TaxID=5507 RepID=A0A2H3U014_FUSOX|nr:related to cytochrome P450 [Fusarium oxysporum]